MRFFRGLVSVLILLLLPSSVHAEGTYSNINTASSSDGGYDAVSWSQGYPLTIDSYGKYIVPIQPDGNSYYNIAYSNDKGATWSEQNLPSDEEFSNRSSVAYDSINDKLHVIETLSTGVTYRRYLILRDNEYNIYSIKEDPTLTPLVLDTLGTCTTDTYGNPIALFKYEGSNGMLVAFWSTEKVGCSGQDITETRASIRVLSNTSDDGTAGNWDSLNNDSDIDTGVGPAIVDYNILYGANTSASSFRQHSAMIRGGTGTHSEDIYYFNADVDDTNGFRRLSWNDSDSKWSGSWTTRATFGAMGSGSGYSLKQELLTKPVYAEAHGKVYVGIARWLDGVNGDTQSVYAVDSSDTVSLISNVYSAGGSHCLYPTLDIAYDSVEEKLYTFYIISGADSVCGNTYYKTYDNTTMSSAQAYYTVTNRSVDIPVTYPTRYDNKILLFYRLNNELDADNPPHEIHFGYVSLDATAPTNVVSLSNGEYSATTYTDFAKTCSDVDTAQVFNRSGGEVALSPKVADDFESTITPYNTLFFNWWTTGVWSSGSYYPNPNGYLDASQTTGVYAYSKQTSLRKVLEFRARFTAHNFEHIGFSDGAFFNRYVMFSTHNNATLRTRVSNGSESGTAIGTSQLGAYHTYKIDWQTSQVDFYIDDVLVDTVTTNIPTLASNVIVSSNAQNAAATMSVDWIHLYEYPDTTGSYTSCILDSGATNTDWGTLTYSSTEPASTAVAVSTRTSNDGVSWSSFSSAIASAADIPSAVGRYLQYKIDLTGTATTGPQVDSLSLTFATPTPTPTPTSTPTSSSDSGSTSTNSSGTSTACTAAKPSVPKLYAILPEDSDTAKLYFTDEGGSYSDLIVRYGTDENNFAFGTQQSVEAGARTSVINDLQSGQQYFFQVRYQNDCNPGDWSNILSITMPNAYSTGDLVVSDISKDEAENTPDRTNSNTTEEKSSETSSTPQKYSVKVKLTDSNGGAVAGATVILHSDPKQTVSDKDGVATFTGVEPGEHTLIVQADELSGEQKITIGGSDPNLVVSVTLRPDPVRSWLLFGGGALGGSILLILLYFAYKKFFE